MCETDKRGNVGSTEYSLKNNHLVMPEPRIGELEADGASLFLEFIVTLDKRLREKTHKI